MPLEKGPGHPPSKRQVVGSSPAGRAIPERSVPVTWVTERT